MHPDAIGPTNITAAAAVMQFSIVAIVVGGTFVLKKGEIELPFYERTESSTITFLWLIIAFALLTLGLLFFSDEFSSIWRPLFRRSEFVGISWSLALLWIFLLDIAWVGGMVLLTGGSYRSPFTPLYFMLPPLAIFLRESAGRIFIYTAVASVLFLMLLAVDRNGQPGERYKPAYAFVSLACFILATYVGVATMP